MYISLDYTNTSWGANTLALSLLATRPSPFVGLLPPPISQFCTYPPSGCLKKLLKITPLNPHQSYLHSAPTQATQLLPHSAR